MRRLSCLVALLAAAWLADGAGPVRAGTILEHIRHDEMLRCAATERPGYAEIVDGAPAGRAADLCRAAAERAMGKGGRFALRLLDLDDDFARLRGGEIELAFLEPRTVAAQRLTEVLTPVGPAYADPFAVMVPDRSRVRTLGDMAGQTVCFMIGDPIWPLLQDGLTARGVPFRPFGFSEEVEMKDAYNVGRCGAMAGVASELEEIRADGGVKHLTSRLLGEPLGSDPVIAYVPRGDADWAAEAARGLAGPADASP